MNYSGEAADQIVRMTIHGVEVGIKLSGMAAERIAALIYTIVKDQKQTAGKTRLVNMLKSGKELNVFTIKSQELPAFKAESKRYGVLFCALKENSSGEDGTIDVMVYKEDASKINRIVERLSLATVEATKAVEVKSSENPTKAKMEKSDPSENTLKTKETSGKATSDTSQGRQKKSVKEIISELRVKREEDTNKKARVREHELEDRIRNAGKALPTGRHDRHEGR